MKIERQTLLPLVPEDDITANLTGKILNIHRLIAHSPNLLNASAPLRNYLVKNSRLTDRQRELLILRTAHRLQSEYEWEHHVIRGKAAGLSDAEIERTKLAPDAEGWLEEESTLLRLVDEMRDEQMLSVDTVRALLAAIGEDGIIDAVFTIGFYLTLGTLLKTFAVPLDESITPL